MGQLATWIILGTLVLIFGIFFIFSAIKDRKIKNKKKKDEIRRHNNSLEQMRYLTFQILALWDKNQELLDNFEPSIGEYKMKEIVNAAHNYLSELEDDLKFKEYIVENVETQHFLSKFIALRETRSNLWNRRCLEIKEYFDKLNKQYDKALFQSEYDEIVSNINQFYKNEFEKAKNEFAK
ncbi:MHJ_0274 family protein [Mycoplasmopsis lipofaciens]|uniref:MHJ_0274 family protein n=1 Tax=Mycoplasmopsis lipofaciens TaxID=114884 RepID=UPI000689ED5A|nr:hypothetical protein [Mycoplasmopsis lipofaciens]